MSNFFSQENNKTNPFENFEHQESQQVNFFGATENVFSTTVEQKEKPEPIIQEKIIAGTLNDFDSNILGNSISLMPNDMAKIELKIDKYEKELKKIKDEINSRNLLNLTDKRVKQLKEKEKELVIKISDCKSQYRNLGFWYRLADLFSDGTSFIINGAKKTKDVVIYKYLLPFGKKLLPFVKSNSNVNFKLQKAMVLQNELNDLVDTKINPSGVSGDLQVNQFVNLMEEFNKM